MQRTKWCNHLIECEREVRDLPETDDIAYICEGNAFADHDIVHRPGAGEGIRICDNNRNA